MPGFRDKMGMAALSDLEGPSSGMRPGAGLGGAAGLSGGGADLGAGLDMGGAGLAGQVADRFGIDEDLAQDIVDFVQENSMGGGMSMEEEMPAMPSKSSAPEAEEEEES